MSLFWEEWEKKYNNYFPTWTSGKTKKLSINLQKISKNIDNKLSADVFDVTLFERLIDQWCSAYDAYVFSSENDFTKYLKRYHL